MEPVSTRRHEQAQFLARLSPAARSKLTAAGRVRTYEDGQILLLEGTPAAPVFLILQGTARVFRTSPDGREQTLIHLLPGAALNMPAAFADRQDAPASAIAVGPVRALVISGWDFRHTASHDQEIALAVFQDLSNRLQHLTQLTYDLSLRSVRGRLARFLLDHTTPLGETPARWTHQEIAAQIGTVREVVSRTLRALVQDGLVKLERHRIMVTDRRALEREAES